VQYLRGFAAILVVLMHANAMMRYPEYFGASPLRLVNIGLFGVAIFFVISGFIMAVVALGPNLEPTVSTRTFILRRFLRIVPFMWVCVIGYNLLSFIGTGKVEWAPALRALTLWPVGELKPNVIWTLRHELLFYLLFALTLLPARRRPWLLALWLVAPLALGAAMPALGFPHVFPGQGLREFFNMAFLGGAHGANLQFGLGLLIGLLWVRGDAVTAPRLPLGPLVTLAVTVGATILIEIATPQVTYYPLLALMWTAVAGLVVWTGVTILPRRGLLDTTGRGLGDASYAIYLVHNAALLVLLAVAARFKSAAPPLVVWLGVSIGAILCGLAVHWIVEKPLVTYLTRRTRRPAHASTEPDAASAALEVRPNESAG